MLTGRRKPGARWLESDTLLQLALTEHEGSLHTCGVPFDEGADPANEGRFTAGLPVRCHACTAIEVAREKVRDSKYPQAGALSVRLVHPDGPHDRADQGEDDADRNDGG